ncbi:uncharacterized protein LACBIDRAFT_303101 [Laccaria bicolor S238N-H82]|uniref:Predicted protein n=1 Tax=Laccaria bicolor (strain S238N-H82 / ATCC MYA-4686) TaxID=486041 RepID=B0DIX9_LACBS|nr:uncharacterized protein LACBIDRAFT_303101 [Laccaria bicolor S238N-H82]EDR05421.1 predicted protein [Laccaria bicolor S238N-H82]|eukprot:XP_001883979.1 predicted protein [Laccaria bicolor S238N-H82]
MPPTGLLQGDPAPNHGEPSSPPASSVPSFNGSTLPAPSGFRLTPPQGPPLPQSVPVDGSGSTDLPYVVQPVSVPPSSSSLPPVNDPTPTGLSQPIPAPNSPVPTNSAVPTGVPMPNISSAPVKGLATSGVPPVSAPDPPAASILPSIPSVDGTPKLSGVPDVDRPPSLPRQDHIKDDECHIRCLGFHIH